MAKQPSLYIPHGGGPCFFMDWTFGPANTWDKMENWLKNLASTLKQQPSAIIIISAHWETKDQVCVTSGSMPKLIYDYYGFPAHTYELTYPSPGSPKLAKQVVEQLNNDDIVCETDSERGFDHGVFIPLKLIYPAANIPIVQLSLRADLDPSFHIRVGESLSAFRNKNIIIVGSGMSYHNLNKFMKGTGAEDESLAFNQWLTKSCLLETQERNRQLIKWYLAPFAKVSHPREEHLLPLMVIAGSATEKGKTIYSDQVMGTHISAIQFG